MKRFVGSAGLALMGILAAGGLAPAWAANILILSGTDSFGPSGGYPNTTAQAAGVLSGELTTAGNTVTIVTTGVPVSLAGYTQIYDVRFANAPVFTPGEMGQLLAFLQAAPNNTIFMMGENGACCSAKDALINTFIALAGGGTVTGPPTSGYSIAVETVAPQFRVPNPITTVSFDACGLVSTSGNGTFASSEPGGGCSVFFGRGALQNAPQGAMVVVYDVNFIATAPDSGFVNEVAFRQNLEQFVSAPPAAAVTTTVPALTTWGLTLLALALCGFAVTVMRSRVITRR